MKYNFSMKLLATALSLACTSGVALAQKKYDTGASDTEIKIGTTMPYSGPASAYGVIGKAIEAYFRKINDEGGINGRKINFIAYDDGYSPPKTVEQIRKLVESDEVLLLFQTLGTATNSAVHKYVNQKKIPHLFVASGATKWNDPKNFPWTTGWQPNYHTEGKIYAQYVLKNKPGAKIAIFYQNDDFGKDYLAGIKEGLGAKAASMVAIEESYETTEPSIDSHIVKMKATNADTLINISTPKFAAQTIKKVAELGWKPLHLMTNVSLSIGSVLTPAGLDNSKDIISAAYMKDVTDPQWKDDAGIKAFDAFLQKYYPDANRIDSSVMFGWSAAQTMEKVLRQAGDNLTRANIMKQAASLKDLELPALLPGIKINTSATDFAPIEAVQLQRFNGKTWERFGEIMGADATH